MLYVVAWHDMASMLRFLLDQFFRGGKVGDDLEERYPEEAGCIRCLICDILSLSGTCLYILVINRYASSMVLCSAMGPTCRVGKVNLFVS